MIAGHNAGIIAGNRRRSMKAWELSDIANLVMLYDFNDSASITKDESNLISVINDKSTLLNHAEQPEDDYKPAWSSNGLNGYGCGVFDGQDDYLQIPFDADANPQEMDFWIVFRNTSNGTSGMCPFETYDVSQAGGYVRQGFRVYCDQYGGRTSLSVCHEPNDIWNSSNVSSSFLGSIQVVRVTTTEDLIRFFHENSLFGSTEQKYRQLVNSSVLPPNIGCLAQGFSSRAGYWKGDIGLILMANSEITGVDYNNLIALINERYGKSYT